MLEEKMLSEKNYTPGGSSSGIRSLVEIARDLKMANHLGFLFASRNIRARYRQSLLGIFWAFFMPLTTSIVWIVLNKQKVFHFDSIPCGYPVFVITGTIMWQVFSASVMGPLNSVTANKSVLTKVNFPRESILISSFYEIALNACIGIVIIILTLILTGTGISAGALYFIPGMITLMLMGITIGLFFLPLSILYQDIQFGLPAAIQFFMYLTPVIYPKPFIDSFLFDYNPVGTILQFSRNQLLGIETGTGVITVAAIFAGVIFLLIVGLLLYRITLETLIERMSA